MILIFGASGTVGSRVAKLLFRAGEKHRLFLRNPEKFDRELFPLVEIFQGDLDDPLCIRDALRGVEKVFLSSPSHPHQVERESSVLQASIAQGIQHIVKLSTLGANPGSSILMSRWHGESEKIIEKSGIHYTLLRSHNFIQNILNFAPSIAAEGVILTPLANAKISMVDARDVAEVAVAALIEDKGKNNIYRLTGPEAISYHRVAEILGKAIGKGVQYEAISLGKARRTLTDIGCPTWYIEDILKLYDQFQAGRGMRVWKDVETILQRPARRFHQFASDYTEVFKTGQYPANFLY